jgi:Ca2+-binding RTX toxin-like protein
MKLPRTRLGFVVAVVASILSTVGATPALAEDPKLHAANPLGLTDFHQLILDEGNGRLFLRATASVLVTDLSGNEITTVAGVPGDGGMALSEDGRSLWVALRDDAAVLRISTSGLTTAGTIPLPEGVCPVSVAETNGKLAVGHACAGPGRGLGVIDLSDESWTDSTDPNAPITNPVVVASPGAPDIVVTAEQPNGPRLVKAFDISTLDPAFIGQKKLSEFSTIHDLAIKPDGTGVVVATRNPDRFELLGLPNLNTKRIYVSEGNGMAVAWSGDGEMLAGGTDAYRDARVYKPRANRSKIEHTTLGRATARGIATDAAGTYVWLVTVGNNGVHRLNVLPGFGWGRCKGRFPNYVGTMGSDVITGTDFDDIVLARGGNDLVDTGFGDDVICGQGGDDTIHPGMGDDIATGSNGRDTVTFERHGAVTVDLIARAATGQGIDKLQNFENVIGSDGDDIVIGTSKSNEIWGRSGSDTIVGLGKGDKLYGQAGSDYIEGGFGNDRIEGGSDADLLIGNGGNDVILGQADDDTLAGVVGDDTLKGGTGADTASFALAGSGVTASLISKSAAGEGSDRLYGIEWLVGSEHDDHLIGSGTTNLLEARGGDDRVDGEAGDDTLYGGTGIDTLNGGSGADACLDGEVHSSCEYEGTTAVATPQWSGVALGEMAVLLPRTKVR